MNKQGPAGSFSFLYCASHLSDPLPVHTVALPNPPAMPCWPPPSQKPDHDWDTPHVRPYRPGFHLISAGAMYSVLLWTALDVAFPKQLLATASTAVREASGAVRSRALLYAATVAFTAMTGAFVAGARAAAAYRGAGGAGH